MELDYSVGQILSQLRTLGIENNTFVFFTSDNGAALMSGPDESKRYTPFLSFSVNLLHMPYLTMMMYFPHYSLFDYYLKVLLC